MTDRSTSETPAGVDTYCRDVEAYLCRKNDGHLIRIVGPAFEMVSGWAALGIPPKIVERGIDRRFERYYAKGPRRRPIRIEFCEADVLDLFDEWRRAVGVRRLGPGPADTETFDVEGDDVEGPGRRRVGLQRHLERVIARLTACRTGGVSRPFDELLDRIVRELDAAGAGARSARGEARARLLTRLDALEAEVVAGAFEHGEPGVIDAVRREAAEELEPFRDRMPRGEYLAAVERSAARLLRERTGLPRIALD